MKNKIVKRVLAATLAAAMGIAMLTGCKSDKGGNSDSTSFTWWIFSNDGEGTYYSKYEENPAVQWLNAQYWDTEKGGLGTKDSGTKLNLTFLNPIAGSESDNYNTMMATGEYPEIIDLAVSPDNAASLYANGVILDLTEYVEEYMPNYLAYLEKNPELKTFVTYKDEEGNTRFYSLPLLHEGSSSAWEGFCYRRDWVVKYCEPSAYVWDLESDYVKENGHPKYTQLSEAEAKNDYTGWKENDVKKFEATPGDDPDNTYSDNVIFPSGTSDPMYISDWEWMMEGFDKAIADRGWADDNSNAYALSIPFQGMNSLGNLVSSFGGGTGSWYIKDGKFSFDALSDNFKTYIDCVSGWYKKGWIDNAFETRTADMMWSVNTASTTQGKVGLWHGMNNNLGTGLRATCANEEDAKDSFVMGCQLPINDIYGTDAQKFKEPDCLFQTSDVEGSIALTDKCEEKDIKALLTMFDWFYSLEGGLLRTYGLSAEQYAGIELDPDLYAELGIKEGYTVGTAEDGRTLYARTVGSDEPACNAIIPGRMCVGLAPRFSDEYVTDEGYSQKNVAHAMEQWGKFKNTGGSLNYNSLLNEEEIALYTKVNTALTTDCQFVYVPQLVKGTMTWDEYAEKINAIENIDEMVAAFQNHVVK